MTQSEIDVVQSLTKEIAPIRKTLIEIDSQLYPLQENRRKVSESLDEKECFLRHLQSRCSASGHSYPDGKSALKYKGHDERDWEYCCDICGTTIVK